MGDGGLQHSPKVETCNYSGALMKSILKMKPGLIGCGWGLALLLMVIAPLDSHQGRAEEAEFERVSLVVENQPLGDVLHTISEMTGYRFRYDNRWKAHPVTVDLENIPLDQSLKRILANLNCAVSYGSNRDVRIFIYESSGAGPAPPPFTPSPHPRLPPQVSPAPYMESKEAAVTPPAPDSQADSPAAETASQDDQDPEESAEAEDETEDEAEPENEDEETIEESSDEILEEGSDEPDQGEDAPPEQDEELDEEVQDGEDGGQRRQGEKDQP